MLSMGLRNTSHLEEAICKSATVTPESVCDHSKCEKPDFTFWQAANLSIGVIDHGEFDFDTHFRLS